MTSHVITAFLLCQGLKCWCTQSFLQDDTIGSRVQLLLSTQRLRCYRTQDVPGVRLVACKYGVGLEHMAELRDWARDMMHVRAH